MDESGRTASLMSPARLAQMKPRAATTPAAWLTQMAADAGHMHVKRIGELGEFLLGNARLPGLAGFAKRLEKLAGDLPDLDLSLLESRGWWARTSGKGRSSGTEFAARFEEIDASVLAMATAAKALGAQQQADMTQVERSLVELEVEYGAMEKIIDQGARWLQDMRNQIKVRQAAASDPQAHRAVLEDSARCDILVDRLKLLRSLCNSCAPVPEQARSNIHRRGLLLQTLQQSFAPQVDDWHAMLAPVANAAADGKIPVESVQLPLDMHADLCEGVKTTLAACERMLAQEQDLIRTLTTLNSPQLPA